ncbi:MAG: DnaA/Hda family protein [Kangiellaceae bacterium]|nr:DnaA/Hda family protein [Kangiellaceae bacterium]
MLQLPLNVQLNDSARFDNFFIGENTQLVSKLSHLDNSNNEFIFVWGAKGNGKTHLAHACSQLIADAGKTVAYLPLDEPFMSAEFLDNLESVDFVCLDGFDVILKNDNWEHAIFNLYNQLKSFSRQLVIFAKFSPNQLNVNLGDLKSRLGAMEVYKLKGIRDSKKPEY